VARDKLVALSTGPMAMDWAKTTRGLLKKHKDTSRKVRDSQRGGNNARKI